MKKPIAATMVVAAFALGATLATVSADAPVAYDEYNGTSKVRDWRVLPGTECQTAGGTRRLVPDGQPLSVCTVTTTTVAPTTTRATTTTSTVAPTTTSTTTSSTTTSAPTTTQPAGAQLVETFDTATSLDRLNVGVYHRNIGHQLLGQAASIWGDNNAQHGGTWHGDHDMACGTPTTARSLSSTKSFGGASNGWKPVVDFHLADIVYWCPNGGGHFMSSMGDVDGYSVLWMSPKQTVTNPTRVCVDVNMTDLGTRQWFKIGVVTDAHYRSTQTSWLGTGSLPGFLASDVGASSLPSDLQNQNALWVSHGGGASAGHPGGIKIGDGGGTSTGFSAGTDRAVRYPVCVTDDAAGITVTITDPATGVVVGRAQQPGANFPAGVVRVVLAEHAYTPNKSETGVPQSYTFHWDNLTAA